MSTALTSPPAARPAVGAYDRLFYSGIAVVMAATVFLGFGPSYYLGVPRGTARTFSGGPITGLVHLHSVVFTAWVLLFVVQTGFVAARRVALHRRLGLAGVGLAVAMFVVGVRTALTAAANGAAPPGITPLTFLVVPIFDILLFAGFFAVAVLKRRDKEAHKRLMLFAYVNVIAAAVARIGFVQALNPLAFFGIAFLFVLAGIAYDLASRGRIHRVYLWGGAVFVASVPLRVALSETAAWQQFAAFLVRIAN